MYEAEIANAYIHVIYVISLFSHIFMLAIAQFSRILECLLGWRYDALAHRADDDDDDDDDEDGGVL